MLDDNFDSPTASVRRCEYSQTDIDEIKWLIEQLNDKMNEQHADTIQMIEMARANVVVLWQVFWGVLIAQGAIWLSTTFWPV